MIKMRPPHWCQVYHQGEKDLVFVSPFMPVSWLLGQFLTILVAINVLYLEREVLKGLTTQ